jgi:CO dehydrogenase maturation factor
MKLAIVGKGGVGKTTLAASLARHLALAGEPVIAVDADPDGNLAAALGVPEDRVPSPIAQMRDLILTRTEAKDGGAGLIFKLNPDVDDLPERFAVNVQGVRLLLLGTVELGGKGCMCPEGALLKALMQHLLLRLPDHVILDMEAGLEHMGRASARGVDALIAVVEPGMRSVQTALRVEHLARDIGIRQTCIVANKVRTPHELETFRQSLAGRKVLAHLPYCEQLAAADLAGQAQDSGDPQWAAAIQQTVEALQQHLHQQVETGCP